MNSFMRWWQRSYLVLVILIAGTVSYAIQGPAYWAAFVGFATAGHLYNLNENRWKS